MSTTDICGWENFLIATIAVNMILNIRIKRFWSIFGGSSSTNNPISLSFVVTSLWVFSSVLTKASWLEKIL